LERLKEEGLLNKAIAQIKKNPDQWSDEDFVTAQRLLGATSTHESQPEAKSERKKPNFIDDETKQNITTRCFQLQVDVLAIISEATITEEKPEGKKILGKLTPEEGEEVIRRLDKIQKEIEDAADPDPGTDSQELFQDGWTLTETLIAKCEGERIPAPDLKISLEKYDSITPAHIGVISGMVQDGEKTIAQLMNLASDKESMAHFLETDVQPRIDRINKRR